MSHGDGISSQTLSRNPVGAPLIIVVQSIPHVRQKLYFLFIGLALSQIGPRKGVNTLTLRSNRSSANMKVLNQICLSVLTIVIFRFTFRAAGQRLGHASHKEWLNANARHNVALLVLRPRASSGEIRFNVLGRLAGCVALSICVTSHNSVNPFIVSEDAIWHCRRGICRAFESARNGVLACP